MLPPPRRRRDPKDDDRHFNRLDTQQGWLSTGRCILASPYARVPAPLRPWHRAPDGLAMTFGYIAGRPAAGVTGYEDARGIVGTEVRA
jgi:hypothetical protein